MPAQHITVREYGRIAVGSRWDAETRTITPLQARQISAYQAGQGKGLFTFEHDAIRATNWVGSFGIGGRTIDVLPKVDGLDTPAADRRCRENLLRMCAVGGLLSAAESDIISMSASRAPLLVAYMKVFARRLAQEWVRGPIRRYVTLEENRPCLKGKLLFPEHIRSNYVHQERFYTAADEFSPDNPISQLLKAALCVCAKHPMIPEAKTTLALFESVRDRPFTRDEVDRVVIDRTLSRYSRLIEMARFMLRHQSPDHGGEGNRTFSLMFDMNVVFERFIAEMLRTALRETTWRADAQVRGKSLLHRNGRGVFQLVPDIGVYQSGRLSALIDTKWKVLDPGKTHNNVSQADMYQMYAYGKEYDVERVVLLYPRTSSTPQHVARYTHPASTGVPERHVEVATVDVSASLTNPRSARALREYLRSLATAMDDDLGDQPGMAPIATA